MEGLMIWFGAVFVGHAMGGADAIRVAASGEITSLEVLPLVGADQLLP
jgi:hypothetical protein